MHVELLEATSIGTCCKYNTVVGCCRYTSRFPRPPQDAKGNVLIILGGSRKALPQQGNNIADDSIIDPIVGQSLRDFLLKIYPGEFEKRKVEMEWVREIAKLGYMYVDSRLLITWLFRRE